MDRTRQAFALITVDRKGLILYPVVFTAAALMVVLGVGVCFLLFSTDPDYRTGLSEGMKWSGAIFTALGPLFAAGAAVMANSFSLALGMSLTRREYVRGAFAFYALQAAIAAIAFTVLREIEVASGGWGLAVRFFDTVYLGQGEWWQFLVQSFLVVLLGSLLLAFVSVAGKRWGRTAWYAMTLVLLVVIAVVVLLAALNLDLLLNVLAMPWISWMVVLLGAEVVLAGLLVAVSLRVEIR